MQKHKGDKYSNFHCCKWTNAGQDINYCENLHTLFMHCTSTWYEEQGVRWGLLLTEGHRTVMRCWRQRRVSLAARDRVNIPEVCRSERLPDPPPLELERITTLPNKRHLSNPPRPPPSVLCCLRLQHTQLMLCAAETDIHTMLIHTKGL